MKAINWRPWGWQYLVPFLVLVGGFLLTRWIADVAFGAADVEILYFLAIAPVLAVGIGYVMKPDHVWVVPALVVVASLVTAAIVESFGHALSITVNFVGLVGVPLTLLIWLGKGIHSRWGDLRHITPSKGSGIHSA